MTVTSKTQSFVSTLAALLWLGQLGCDDGQLRGSVSDSPDGGTYLAVVDDNGGQCGPIFVDGEVWPLALGERGPIEPGTHSIACGTELRFSIPEGVVFEFDYWGP